MRTKIFSNDFARRNFYFLLFGFAAIFATFLYVMVGLQNLSEHQSYNKELVNQVVRVLGLASVAPSDELPQLVRTMNNQFLEINIDPNPISDSEKLVSFNPQHIRSLMRAKDNEAKISYPVEHNLWLNIVTHNSGDAGWLGVSFYILAVILILMLFFLCLWVVRKMTMPLEFFMEATRRFEADVNAPALPEIGYGPIRDTIQSFNKMQSKIKKLIFDRIQMLAAISHDLRTPITRLRLRAENIADYNKDQYSKISSDLDELESMVNSVLKFARDDSKQEAKERFDINALLETLCADMSDAGFDVSYNGLEGKMPFFGRINGLRRAFTNLVDNAIKYGKCAQVTLRDEGKALVVEVVDKGPGIPSSDMDRIFDPFYRAEKSRSRQTGGVGLGLTVTKDILDAHDANIDLVNLAEGGLRVVVTLPVSWKKGSSKNEQFDF